MRSLLLPAPLVYLRSLYATPCFRRPYFSFCGLGEGGSCLLCLSSVFSGGDDCVSAFVIFFALPLSLFLSHSPFPIRFSFVFSLREPINYILISRRLSSPFCTFSLARCTPRFSEARHGFAGSIRDRLTFWVTPSRPCECRNKSLCLSRSMDAPAVFSSRVLRVSPSRPISGEIDNASFCTISIGPLFVVAREALSVGFAKKAGPVISNAAEIRVNASSII